MSVAASIPPLADLRRAPHSEKCGRDWQEQLWAHWSMEGQWPGSLDVYEAAAYRRIHPDTIRRACTPDRKGKAKLAHQRLGMSIRIRKANLDRFGEVTERTAA